MSNLYEKWINSKCPYRPPTHYTLYLVLTEQNENKEAQGTVLYTVSQSRASECAQSTCQCSPITKKIW